MPKITKDNDIKEKLNYIGLDLDKIPEFFTDTKPIDYKPIKAYDENGYKVYKYIPISKIQILLTPTNRLNTIKEKYSKASNLKSYLHPETEEDIIKHTTFIKMLNKVKIEKIEEIVKEQDKLNKQIPFQVKFEENYLWQIYYSDTDDIYFMLVPTEDLEYASFFYLLKKQIEYHKTKKEQMIFVPIVYENYSNEFLKNSEVADIEKYLWFFTKNWSKLYDVYDKKQKISIHIVGETILFDNVKCIYKNKLESKEEALKFYKFLKAMFILSTELPHDYKFEIRLNRYGALEFKYQNKKITYDNMFSLLADNYEKAREEIGSLENERTELEEKLQELKIISASKDEEYLLKERQIATYLECRKTFFGRVKYFFTSKKKSNLKVGDKNQPKETKHKKEATESIISSFTLKEFYTVDDIVKIYKELEKISTIVKNLKMDENALKSKIENVETKIKNANLYIEEIDKHEKSIFEFWKFANKDENLMLNQGTVVENVSHKKIEKVYNYVEDKEEICTLIDKTQRANLTKEENDSVYIATTNCLNAIRNIENKEVVEENLKELKEELQNNRILFEKDKIDIFGGITEDNTKIKMIGTKKHRETKKDKLKILGITKDLKLKEYKNKLMEILDNITEALKKTKHLIGISVYIVLNEDEKLKGLQICTLNAEEAIENCVEEEISLYKINLKENAKVIYFSNSIYYDNYNKTLPLGMNISDKCIIDLDMYKQKIVKKDEFRINKLEDEFKIQNKKILLKEIELEDKV